jgi:hypothetical protein
VGWRPSPTSPSVLAGPDGGAVTALAAGLTTSPTGTPWPTQWGSCHSKRAKCLSRGGIAVPQDLSIRY